MDTEADELEGWSYPSEVSAARKSTAVAPPPAAHASQSHRARDGTDGPTTCHSGHPPVARPAASWLPQLPVSTCELQERLEVAGYAVFDHAAGPAWAASVRDEILGQVSQGTLTPSMNKLAAARDSVTGAVTAGHTLAKIGVFELDLCVNGEVREPEVLQQCPHIRQFWERDGPALATTLSAACPSLKLTGVDSIKLQYSDGTGGCFPVHYDTSLSHSRREVTAVLYLNPQWEKGDGGELRLYPFPLGTVDVAPRMDRLVLFNSTEMLHRVLPATAPRVCLSVWFARDGGSNRMSLPCRLPRAVAEDEGGGMLKFLLQPSNRKVLTKIVYANAWAESFEDAFGTGPEVQEALALNRADSKAATSTISAELLDLVRECLPIPVPPELATPVVCEEPQPTPSLGGTTPEPAPTALARVPLVAHAATHPAAPATSGAQPGAQRPAALDVMGGTFGGMYSDAFIATVRPLYDLHMGVETMAPLLYALIRFTKPTIVMEIGAGYTTPFMLQALKDNYTEITHLRSLHQVGKCVVEGMPWCVESSVTGAQPFPLLQCVDNLAHEHTTAHLVIEAAEKLEALDHLDLYFKDAYEFLHERKGAEVDMAFLDFGQGDKIGVFITELWPHLRPGALVLVHSTLTNSLTRAWLESMREMANDVTSVFGSFATMSLREPHKMFQNSFSIFQKRDGFTEPILTKYP